MCFFEGEMLQNVRQFLVKGRTYTPALIMPCPLSLTDEAASRRLSPLGCFAHIMRQCRGTVTNNSGDASRQGLHFVEIPRFEKEKPRLDLRLLPPPPPQGSPE